MRPTGTGTYRLSTTTTVVVGTGINSSVEVKFPFWKLPETNRKMNITVRKRASMMVSMIPSGFKID